MTRFKSANWPLNPDSSYTKIGRHYGKNRLLKVFGLVWRSIQLLPFVLRERPVVGLSHGSRAQILLCNLLRIPTIMVNDYEYAKTPPLVRPRWEIVPDVLFNENLHCKNRERIRTYRGIKEDVYAPEFRPDPSLVEQLQLNGDVIVTVRPPATEAHYHNPESEKLFVQFMNRLCDTRGTKAVLLPRNKNQETEIRKHWPQWFEDSKVIIPREAVDGLNLLWHSDLVVSGGGTMNREAAALDVPVYSIFRGKIGAVDRRLQSEGRLTLIESIEEVQTRIAFRRREKSGSPDNQPRQALRDIVDHVEEIVRTEYPGAMPSTIAGEAQRTMKTLKMMVIAGARPNFMKIAPLMKAISEYNSRNGNGAPAIHARLLHTGQHYDEKMSEIFFGELGIPAPDINMGVGSGSHAVQTANVMTRFETVCEQERPDWIVVVGDVNSTMACTLVGAKMGIKVAHVEAGLRSFDRTMPEEINRIVTDSLADLLLTPSQDANENLKREGVADSKIKLVGNIMIDALIANLQKSRASNLPKQLGLVHNGFVYVTLHRPSNVDDERSLTAIMAELKRVTRELPVAFPMHPRTRKMCAQYGISLETNHGLKILDPIGYHDSLCLTENARLVLTDSGGLQEESTYFRTPCLTLRANTERPITVAVGSNKLTRPETLPGDIDDLLNREPRFGEIPPLWDGQTAAGLSMRFSHELDSSRIDRRFAGVFNPRGFR